MISLFCGLLAGYALSRLKFRFAGTPRHRHLHHLPGAADAAVHSARRHHPQLPARRHAVGADPDLSDLPHSVLHLAADGLFQGDPARARGMRAHRRRDALEGDGLHHLPDRACRASCRPASSPSRCRGTSSSMRWCFCPRPSRRRSRSASPRSWCAATCSIWGQLMAGALLGSIPGRVHLLVLRRALRRRPHRLGEGIEG